MISKKELLKGRDKQFPNEYTQEISDNLDELLIKLNKFRAAYGKPMYCSSGWRPLSVNNRVSKAKKSKHMLGQAADFVDKDKELAKFCLQNEELLIKIGLWMEHPDYTSSWCHFQSVPPKSGKRYYIP